MGLQKLDDYHLLVEEDSVVVQGKGSGADNSKEVGLGAAIPDLHPPTFRGVVEGLTIPDLDQDLAATTASLILVMLNDRWNSGLRIMSAGEKQRSIFSGCILERFKHPSSSHQVHWHYERLRYVVR